jgi:hypothetical protein
MRFRMPAHVTKKAGVTAKAHATKEKPGPQSPGTACYELTTPTGTTVVCGKTALSIAVVEAVIAHGLTPHDVRAAVGGANLRRSPGTLTGDALWAALSASGAPGGRSHWFVEAPIRLRGDTWVLRKRIWTDAKVQQLAALCGLTAGRVDFRAC